MKKAVSTIPAGLECENAMKLLMLSMRKFTNIYVLINELQYTDSACRRVEISLH